MPRLHFILVDVFIDFNRVPSWNCPPPVSESQTPVATTPQPIKRQPAIQEKPQAVNPPPRPFASNTPVVEVPKKDPAVSPSASEVEPWYIPPVECPEPQDNVFYAQIGPAGGKKGYTSITGMFIFDTRGSWFPRLSSRVGNTMQLLI